MAVTAIWNIKGWIGSVLNYTVNPEKTENPEWSEKQQQSMLDVMEYAMQSAPKKVLDKIIDYAIDDFKTEKQYYVTGINCDPATARNDMILTKRIWGKEGGNIAWTTLSVARPSSPEQRGTSSTPSIRSPKCSSVAVAGSGRPTS